MAAVLLECYPPTFRMLLAMWSRCWETLWHRVICSLFSCRTRVLLGIARSVVFIIPRLVLYFVLDSSIKFDLQIVINHRKHRESGRAAYAMWLVKIIIFFGQRVAVSQLSFNFMAFPHYHSYCNNYFFYSKNIIS